MSPLINLQLGWPSPRLFPAEQLAAATAKCLSDPDIAASALIYGPDLGYMPLRCSVSDWLSKFYLPSSGPISTDRIAITGGASQSLANILLAFSDKTLTQRVWMVEPTYFLACTIFEDAGLVGKLRGVPENEHGIDILFLREALSKFENEEKAKSKTESEAEPADQTGKTYSVPVRQQLLELAREYDILIISDDVYDFLRWPAEESPSSSVKLAPIPPRMVDLDRASSEPHAWGNCISNGSFSKIVAPGVRVGWVESSERMITRLGQNGANRSGGAPSHLTSTFIHPLLSLGAMQKHIDETLIPTYQSRYRTMISAIKTHLEPLGVQITTGAPYMIPETSDIVVPAGGFFTYITFPPQLPSADVIAGRAREDYGLIFVNGKMFVVNGDDSSVERAKEGFGNGARLCWAWHESEEIEEGIVDLSNLLKNMLEEAKSA